MKLKKVWLLILSILASFAAGFVGSLATTPNIGTWYVPLAKPPLLPPNWVFAPVWTLLYLLMGIALYLVITSDSKKPKKMAYVLFGVQLVLNALWSLVFFGAHYVWLGLVIILLLLGVLVIVAFLFGRISRPAMYLMWPYIAWICFASYLNLGVALLN